MPHWATLIIFNTNIMKFFLRFFCAFILFTTSFMLLKAQSVKVNILVFPPYSTHISDYANSNLVQLTNTTNQTLRIYLKADITGPDALHIFTKPGHKPPQPLILGAGQSTIINGLQNDFLLPGNLNYEMSDDVKQKIFFGGIFPEGIYTLCGNVYNFDNGQILSDDLQGCKTFNIQYLQPPIITQPICEAEIKENQQLVFRWTPLAAIGANFLYKLYIAEILPVQNKEETIQQAIANNLGNPIVLDNISTNQYIYNPNLDAPLKPNTRYAFALVARDAADKYQIENFGRTDVCEFTYQPKLDEVIIVPPAPNYAVNKVCKACNTAIPQGNAVSGKDVIKISDKIKVGEFEMTVNSFTTTGNTFSGTGKIPMPLLNNSYVGILVDFKNITINSNKEMLAGQVTAQLQPDYGVIPNISLPNPQLGKVNPLKAKSVGNYLSQQEDKLIDALNQAINQTGFKVPFGIKKVISGQTFIVGIDKILFTPTQATFDAMLSMEIPEAPEGAKKIAFGASELCFNKNSFCDQGILYLAEDFTIPYLKLKLLAPTGEIKNVENDKGTYVIFDKSGFKQMRIDAEREFDETDLQPAEGAGKVKAHLVAVTDNGWSDWKAKVTMPKFSIASNKDISFEIVNGADGVGAWYDHSDKENPAGLPTNIPEKLAALSPKTWKGFFMPELKMTLPAIIKNTDNQLIAINVKNLLIDNDGVTLDAKANNVLAIGDGKLDSWAFSVDNFNITIINSVYIKGDMLGKVLLPITTEALNSQLDYSAMLTNSLDSGQNVNRHLDFAFHVQPKNDIDNKLWLATMNLKNTSTIDIKVNKKNGFVATAVLNGDLSLASPELSNFSLSLIHFQNLTLNTKEPYIDTLKSKVSYFSFASPQKKASGFPLTLTDVKLSGLTLKLTGNLELSDIKALPKASVGISIRGRLGFNNKGRLMPEAPIFSVNKIELKDANLAGVKVSGTLEFVNDANKEGIIGDLKATFLKGTTIKAQAEFGHSGTGDSKFSYFRVDGMAKIPLGIILFGDVKLKGFGGGLSYHMKANVADVASGFKGLKTGGVDTLTANKSFVGYTADVNAGIGLKALAYIATSKEELFNADLSIMAIANANLTALNQIILDGNCKLLTKDDDGNAMVKATGNLHIDLDLDRDIYNGEASVNIDAANVLTADGKLQVYSGNGNWFIKMGTPTAPSNINVIKLFTLKSYFEMGNSIDPMPEPPQLVKDLLQSGGFVYKRDQRGMQDSKSGFIVGASFTTDIKTDLGLIKGEIAATMGFDMALNTGKTCNDGTPAGLNGLYAQGQIYAGIKAKVLLHIELLVWDDDVTIFDAGAGALLQGGLPNPTWAMGVVAGNYNVLDGLVKGKFNLHFKIGDKCTPESLDPLESIKIIEDIQPKDNEKDVSIAVNPSASFNMEVGKIFEIIIPNPANAENDITKKYRISPSDVTQTIAYQNGNKVSATSSNLYNVTAVTYTPNAYLNKKADVKYTVEVKLSEQINGNWETAKYIKDVKDKVSGNILHAKNSEFKEIRETTFTTDNGLKEIPETDILATWPLRNQVFYLQNDYTEKPAGLQNNKTLDIVNNFSWYDANRLTFEGVAARFTPVTGNPTPIIVNATLAGADIKLDTKPTLANETVYKLEVFAKLKSKNNVATSQKSISTSSAIASNNLEYNISRNKLNGMATSNLEGKLFAFYFRTSKYNTINQKMADCRILKNTTAKQNMGQNLDVFTLQSFIGYTLNDAKTAIENKYPTQKPLQAVDVNTTIKLPEEIQDIDFEAAADNNIPLYDFKDIDYLTQMGITLIMPIEAASYTSINRSSDFTYKSRLGLKSDEISTGLLNSMSPVNMPNGSALNINSAYGIISGHQYYTMGGKITNTANPDIVKVTNFGQNVVNPANQNMAFNGIAVSGLQGNSSVSFMGNSPAPTAAFAKGLSKGMR
ncbi:MAG: hypothetical protein EAZ15_05000 [Sphingobacteriales bacterium]|nr:MAG: hypothetical protein EAZ15_05000 [Sphingobacteriales bacterium]